jgi:regulator of CtrA degradation
MAATSPPRYGHSIMGLTPSINPRIVEGLYAEALVLADEVRARFDRSRLSPQEAGDDLARVALSCEALRTTTRIMHCLAWLLNHRAHFAGELSELQLRRHGRLIANYAQSEREALAELPADVQKLVAESERLYERILRLESAWRGSQDQAPSAIERLRERLRQG